jgi:hypothetical protein
MHIRIIWLPEGLGSMKKASKINKLIQPNLAERKEVKQGHVKG